LGTPSPGRLAVNTERKQKEKDKENK